MRHAEHAHQVALLQWARTKQIPNAPDIEPGSFVSDYLFAIPNGGRRNPREAGRMKAEGVKAGVSDLLLPIARSGSIGLWIEMKSSTGRMTPAQREWVARMRLAGYRAERCDDWISAADAIARYLGVTSPATARARTIAPIATAKGRRCTE